MTTQILGANKKLVAGNGGMCLRGNPLPVARYHELDGRYQYRYIVKTHYYLGYRYYKVIGEL